MSMASQIKSFVLGLPYLIGFMFNLPLLNRLSPSPLLGNKNSAGLKKRLICHVVDELALNKPEQLFCVHPISNDLAQGWRHISMKDLADAVNYTAWWIEKTIGVGTGAEPITYIGTNDARYVAFFLACLKTGHVALLLSPRNSTAASLHILGATRCSKIVYSDSRRKFVGQLQDADVGIRSWEMPDLWKVFGQKSAVYPFTARYDDVEDQAAVIIHSSGSTGLPKPVYLTNGFFAVIDRFDQIPTPAGRQSAVLNTAMPGQSVFSMSPMFHIIGLYVCTVPIFHGKPIVLSPERPMTDALLTEIVDVTKPDGAILTPSVIEDIISSEQGKDTLTSFKGIFYGGAPFSPGVGDWLQQHVPIYSIFGSSESGYIGCYTPLDSEDWQYHEWNPLLGAKMEDIGDGVYELVMHRDGNRDFKGIFHTFPDIQQYRTKDLFVAHPSKPGLWKYYGRSDDVIVLSNGEKFNPIDMEKAIERDPLVAKCLIVGQERFQSALLVQVDWQQVGSEDSDSIIGRIWPAVEKANRTAPGHAKILKTKIKLVAESKPFTLTAKGSIQRRQVARDYADDIEAVYSQVDEETTALPAAATFNEIKEYINATVSRLLSVEHVSNSSDIFSLGIDSLQTLQLGKILQGAVRFSKPESSYQSITIQKLYSLSTIDELSGYVYQVIYGGPSFVHEKHADALRTERVAAMVSKYTIDLPKRKAQHFKRARTSTVILTGSTGSLGNYILRELLNEPSILKIYCLNRSGDAKQRQFQSFKEKGLTVDGLDSRVEFLQAQFGSVQLGLSDQRYTELQQSVDLIIHNAWKVNFNHRVEAFENPHIHGVRRLVDLCLASSNAPHLHFISSISTVGNWTSKHSQSIPEATLDSPDVTMQQGYGESKYLAEQICAAASSASGVPTSIHRVGQIGGPTTAKGVWNRQEWLPSMIATSKTLGKIPKTLGNTLVDWTPVDDAARIIVDITQSRRSNEHSRRAAVFHLVNPNATTWESLIPAVQKFYPVEPVDLKDWVIALESFNNPTNVDLLTKPALKIIEFYQELLSAEDVLVAETRQTQAASKTMRAIRPVDASLMETWLKQWSF
ncbi:hypothetical protein MW887_005745 [Aspergillus wentii]|nr:hypothetical protein MW887_005745 [Aspergillus wentii]